MKYCGACNRQATESLLETHHRKPRNAGGEDDLSNLIDLCPDCHTSTHLIARMLKKKGAPLTGTIQEYLDTNYSQNRQAHEMLIELARTVVIEEEQNLKKDFVNVFYRPNNVNHQKLKDMAKQSKVSMTDLIDLLVESEYRRRMRL